MAKYITLFIVCLLPFKGKGQVAKVGAGQTIYLTSTSTATLDGSASHGIKYHWKDVSTDYGSGIITNKDSKKTTVTGLSQGVFYYQLEVTTGRKSVYSITTVKVDYAPPPPTETLIKTLPLAGIKSLTNNRSDTLHDVGYTFPNFYVDPTWGEIWMERARLNQQFVDAQNGKYYTTIEDGYDWQGKGYGRSELYFGDYALKTGETYMFEWKGYFPQPIIGNIPDVQDGQFARVTAIMQIHGSDGYPPPFGFGIRQDSIVFDEWGRNGNGATTTTKIMSTDSDYIEKAHTIRFYLKEGPAESGAFIKVLVDGVLKYERTSGQVGQTPGGDFPKFATLYDWGKFIVDPNNHTRNKKFSMITEAFNIYTVTDTSTISQQH